MNGQQQAALAANIFVMHMAANDNLKNLCAEAVDEAAHASFTAARAFMRVQFKETSALHLSDVDADSDRIKAWDAGTEYKPGDKAMVGKAVYECTHRIITSEPFPGSPFWKPVAVDYREVPVDSEGGMTTLGADS